MKTLRLTLTLVTFLLVGGTLCAQITQTVRGSVKDVDTKSSLPTATVALYQNNTLVKGASADMDGNFRIDEVPVGRYNLITSFIGYGQRTIPNIVVNSGKELVMNIEMEESVVKIDEVQITATKNTMEALNEMATLSARAFTVEETERYAGSRGDPARMASNFAGCQGADDSRNDIVVRGNSPLGVVYRLEGVDIPNPNHFGISGSAGGPVSILNNKMLSNSDFFTGAFPAEYGNSIAGIFDLKMRNGNNEKHEFTGQFGFLGTELTAEGPISREKRSSYLVNYRYSSLTLFSFMGIQIGTTAVPKYQDGSFKFNFPNKKGSISLFGIGGKSNIDILVSTQKPEDIEIYGDRDRDQYFGSGMGFIGMSMVRSLGDKTYGKFIISQAAEEQHTHHEYVYRTKDSTGKFIQDADGYYLLDSLPAILDFDFKTYKTSAAFFVNHKVNAKHVVKAGVNADMYTFNMQDSAYNFNTTFDWSKRWDYEGQAFLLRPYAMWKWKLSPKLVLNSGVHSQFFTLNGSISAVEPRAGLKFFADEKNTFSVGFGVHSQLQPLYTYFYQVPDGSGGYMKHNFGMDFTKSTHFVVGYEAPLFTTMRFRFESYYQSLNSVPVTVAPSSFSLVNMGSGFDRFFPEQLENTGVGENYGAEATIEGKIGKDFLFMLTGSLYESKYKGSDGVWRKTDFSGLYATNLLLAKEFKVSNKSSLSFGTKITFAGNKRHGLVDTAATALIGEIVYVDSTRNSLQFAPYFRADIKINFKVNAKKVTHEIGLDLVNISGQENVLKETYAPDPEDPTANSVLEEYQLGFLPIFYYRIDF